MRLYMWKNHNKQKEDDPDFVVHQKQRTGADDGSPAYQTVTVGYAWKKEGPVEPYLDVKIEGLTNNQPKHGN